MFGPAAGPGIVPWGDQHPPDGQWPRARGRWPPSGRWRAASNDLELCPRGPGAAGAGGRAHRPAWPFFEEDGLEPVSAACRAAVRRSGGRRRARPATTSSRRARPAGRGARRRFSTSCPSTRRRAGCRPRLEGRGGDELSAVDARDASTRCAASSRRCAPIPGGVRAARCASSARPTYGSNATATPCAWWRPTSPRPCAGALRANRRGARPSRRQAHAGARTPARSACRPWWCRLGCMSAGLPVCVQLIGRRGHERALLALARELESAFGGWLDPDAP